MPPHTDSQNREAATRVARYYRSRGESTPDVYVQEEGRWRSYGWRGSPVNHGKGAIPQDILAQLDEIDWAEALRLLQARPGRLGTRIKKRREGRRKWVRVVLSSAAVLLVLFALYLFPLCYTMRAVWSPFAPAESVRFHGRDYRGGTDVPPDTIEDMVNIGRAWWPDGKMYVDSGYFPDFVASDPTGIVVETPAGSHHYRMYGLVGGP